MKKIICLGDTHGRTTWKDIVTKELPDEVVFIGDYLDSFGISAENQLNNLKDILEYKKYSEISGKKVVLLIGNHDFHYMKCAGESYSGYQNGMQYIFNEILENNMKEFQMCYRINDLLFSHAGISNAWYDTQCKKYELEVLQSVDENINYLWNTTGNPFKFNGKDPYGNDITQGPLWIRPQSLYVDRIDKFTQIVGHTSVKHINPPKEESQFYLIDALEQNKEYLEILLEEDNTYKINIKTL
jgi:hypothetical protein